MSGLGGINQMGRLFLFFCFWKNLLKPSYSYGVSFLFCFAFGLLFFLRCCMFFFFLLLFLFCFCFYFFFLVVFFFLFFGGGRGGGGGVGDGGKRTYFKSLYKYVHLLIPVKLSQVFFFFVILF